MLRAAGRAVVWFLTSAARAQSQIGDLTAQRLARQQARAATRVADQAAATATATRRAARRAELAKARADLQAATAREKNLRAEMEALKTSQQTVLSANDVAANKQAQTLQSVAAQLTLADGGKAQDLVWEQSVKARQSQELQSAAQHNQQEAARKTARAAKERARKQQHEQELTQSLERRKKRSESRRKRREQREAAERAEHATWHQKMTQQVCGAALRVCTPRAGLNRVRVCVAVYRPRLRRRSSRRSRRSSSRCAPRATPRPRPSWRSAPVWCVSG